MKFRQAVIILLAALLFPSCGINEKPADRAFYSWKTVFRLSESERDYLKKFSIDKLYLRFFDVKWDSGINDAVPAGEILFRDSVPEGISVIPVVFITNNAISKSGPAELRNLAKRITAKTTGICRENSINISEMQIDCDWTESTKSKYFALLDEIKSDLHKRKIILSATIRLHQVKYHKKTGIPPSDKGMLMYYNMGKLDAGALRNSVYNTTDAALYNDYINSYPLKLDAALPVFNLVIQMRRGRIIELINKSYANDLFNDTRFRKLDENNFTAAESFFLHGIYFMKDDIIKIENVQPGELLNAAEILSEKLRYGKRTVSLFDLDTLNLRNYNEEDIKKIFAYFR